MKLPVECFLQTEPPHGKPAMTCVTSKDSDQPVHPPRMARVPVYPALDSLEAIEGIYDQRRLWSDCTDASLRWTHALL